MASIVELANAVAAAMPELHAQVCFVPEFSLSEIADRKIVVVPTGTDYGLTARHGREVRHKVSVGVLKRCNEDEIEPLLALCDEIARRFHGRRLLDAVCIEAQRDPLYSPEHLRERNQFTGVIVLTFRSLVRED